MVFTNFVMFSSNEGILALPKYINFFLPQIVWPVAGILIPGANAIGRGNGLARSNLRNAALRIQVPKSL